MSNISANIVVDSNPINIIVEPSGPINVGVEPINLSVFTTGGVLVPGGNINELQYNAGGSFAGVPAVVYDGSGLVIQQPTQIENIQVTQVANLGDVANLTITGGDNGYVLQTDGTGNLSWVIQTGGSGNGAPGGANTQIQYNDQGAFGGNVGFTFNEVTGNINIPGVIIGDGGGISNVIGANVTGTVANANFATSAESANTANTANTANSATTAGTVTTNAQPNITGVGTLTSLTVEGTTSIQQAKEKVTSNALGSTGTINYNLLDQAILLKTANASGNFTLNFRGNSLVTLNSILDVDESITCTFINTNGSTARTLTQLQIDGSNITPEYIFPGNTIGQPTANGRDSYNFNIIKTGANAYIVLASKIGFL